jgi:enoyl-CoA hydratase
MKSYDGYKFLRMERRGRILVIVMDNPPVNTVTLPMHEELSRIFFDVNSDSDAAVVVLTGAGRSFTSGGDIKGMLERMERHQYEKTVAGMHEQREILRGLLNIEKPVIARVNGHAMGVGATLAVFSDVSFMVEEARIADTHVKVGLSAGDGGALIWPLLMGFQRAREYLFTGDPLTGAQAAALGLISHAVPEAELDARVYALAERLAGGATLAINATKRSVNLVLKRLLEDIIDAHLGLETYTHFSDDHREAVRAFAEKRQPRFRGS